MCQEAEEGEVLSYQVTNPYGPADKIFSPISFDSNHVLSPLVSGATSKFIVSVSDGSLVRQQEFVWESGYL